MCAFKPKASMTTMTAGCLPAAVGRARKAGISPSWVRTFTMLDVVSIGCASQKVVPATDNGRLAAIARVRLTAARRLA
jgi:hypothetical protein